MKWLVVFHAAVEQDVSEAAAWYEAQQAGLGSEFLEEVIRVWDALTENPLLHCRHHPIRNIRWCYPDQFPYRIIYEVIESQKIIVVAAVLHAARHDRHWKKRI